MGGGGAVAEEGFKGATEEGGGGHHGGGAEGEESAEEEEPQGALRGAGDVGGDKLGDEGDKEEDDLRVGEVEDDASEEEVAGGEGVGGLRLEACAPHAPGDGEEITCPDGGDEVGEAWEAVEERRNAKDGEGDVDEEPGDEAGGHAQSCPRAEAGGLGQDETDVRPRGERNE